MTDENFKKWEEILRSSFEGFLKRLTRHYQNGNLVEITDDLQESLRGNIMKFQILAVKKQPDVTLNRITGSYELNGHLSKEIKNG